MTADVRSEALDALLAGYVAGRLAAPIQALVEAHLELSDRNRGFVADLEEVAARELEDIAPVALPDRDRRLAAILALDAAPAAAAHRAARGTSERPPRAPARLSPGRPDRFPAALGRYLGRDLAAVPWRMLVPGLKEWRPPEDAGCRTRLLKARAGMAMPAHTHEGIEVTLVLKGGFTDTLGHHVAGDICVADEDVDHRPVIDRDGECICAVVYDGPLRLTGPVGRFLAPFVRL